MSTKILDRLGEIITWDLPSGEVALTKLRDSLKANGFDPDLVRDMEPDNAFARAAKHLKKERVIDRVKKDGSTITFQFTNKHVGDVVEFDYECMMKLDCDSGVVSSGDGPALAKEAQDHIEHAIKHRTSNDVSNIVKKLFAKHADLFAISSKGVAYFVPAEHLEFTERVENMLSDCGGSLDRFPVPSDGGKGNESVQKTINASFERMVSELSGAVDGWDADTRPTSMAKAQEQLDLVKHKAAAYAHCFGKQQQAMLDAIEATNAKLIEKSGIVTTLREEAKEAKKPKESEASEVAATAV